ncbi:hypothetical protein [Shewanella sp. MF08487]|uniref:hypothetical protein n=1 Tax=Shewanella sp. MF08487 TaxID=3434873 RepID=UPI003D7992C6
MKSYLKQEDTISIVVIGSFDPSIFHPQWFIRHQLVHEEDLKPPFLELNVVHRQLSQFKSSWFALEVVDNRLLLNTSDMTRSEDLRDLACNIFNILTEITITAIGLNRTSVYKCMTVNSWHKIGYTIAPKDIWLKSFPQAITTPGGIGMKKADIQLERWDDIPGHILISAFPSNYPPEQEVTLTLNDHISFAKLVENRKDITFSSFLIEYWDDFYKNSEDGINNILKEIENE